jgi:hypothetical protein
VKYHAANGFLTKDRTEQLYTSGGLEQARSIVAAVTSALETSPIYVYWRDWVATHPAMTREERLAIDDIIAQGYPRERLYSYRLRVVEDVERRHRALPPPPPLPGVIVAQPPAPAPAPAPTRTRDDVSDLPGMV